MAYCFGWEQNIHGKWGCKVTTMPCDGKDETCPFFKTLQKYTEGIDKANRRIASLPEWQQAFIADTYYGGEKPWMRIKFEPDKDLDRIIMDVVGCV